jgi:hypothetical protein
MGRFILFAVFLVIARGALAAPPENADPTLGPWYQSLKQPGSGVSCCSIADCRQVDYRTEGDHYEALIDGKWLLVPPERVLAHETNPTGHGVVCWTPWQGILCFVTAAET